jgi:hypothetical protein
MSKNTLRTLALILCVLTLSMLCSCSKQFVGEEQAKRAGLALMRQAFGVNLQDAHVEYVERAGTSVLDNTEVPPDANRTECIYIVTISDQSMGADLYYAEVDAKTGVAYYATKNEWLLAPLSENQEQATQANIQTDGMEAEASLQKECAKDTACDFVMRRFQKEVALICTQGCRWNGERSSSACIGYYVTFADGALYRVGFSWPGMDMNEVQVLDTKSVGERP